MKVEFYPLKEIPLNEMKYAVVMARYSGKWIFVQHRDRKSWEIPGGHVEAEESVFDCAARELMEETGAIKFALFPVAIYSVSKDCDTVLKSNRLSLENNESKGKDSPEKCYGMLFFADVHEMGPLPEKSEMRKQELFLKLPEKLTYPEIQPHLYFRTFEFLRERGI